MAGRNWYRDEPEQDWEDWASRGENRPIIDTCPVCGEPIYGADDEYEADYAYLIDGDYVHCDCVIDYLDKNGYRVEE